MQSIQYAHTGAVSYTSIEQKYSEGAKGAESRQAPPKHYHRQCYSEKQTRQYLPKKAASELPTALTETSRLLTRSVRRKAVTPVIITLPELKNEYNEHPIVAACRQGQEDIVRKVLDKNPELINQSFASESSKSTTSLLYLAVQQGHFNIVKLLLDQNADVNAANRHGRTPLHAAAQQGHLDVARLLLDNNADVNALDIIGKTPLHSASHHDTARLLLENNANVNTKNIIGWSPLYAATLKGHFDIVELLLAYNADVNTETIDGENPLHAIALQVYPAARKKDQLDIAGLLLEYADVNAQNKNSKTPLYLAALEGNFNIAKLFLENNADVNAKNKHRWTLLHTAARKNHVGVARHLLNNNADVNAETRNGWTPLHQAALNGNYQVVDLLLSHGAKYNTRTRELGSFQSYLPFLSSTPLYQAKYGKRIRISQMRFSGPKEYQNQKYNNTISLLKAAKKQEKTDKDSDSKEMKRPPLSRLKNLLNIKTYHPNEKKTVEETEMRVIQELNDPEPYSTPQEQQDFTTQSRGRPQGRGQTQGLESTI